MTSISSSKLTYTSYTSAEKREDNISNPQGGKIGSVRIMESPWHGEGRLVPSKEISLCEIVRAGEASQRRKNARILSFRTCDLQMYHPHP